MSISYYTCGGCGWNCCDVDCIWCDCGSPHHDEKCGELTNYGEWNDETESHAIDSEQPITCVICRNEKYTTESLLAGLLKHFNLTEKEAFELIKKDEEENA